MIRVAIADDSPFTCNLLASYIQEGGDCEVVGLAHDTASTLDLVRTAVPDVLTLDLQMPGGNGLDLLRQISSNPSVAVVVISGVTKLAAATTLRALQLGAVDFVLKYTPGAPVSRASLKREILTKVKMAAAAQPAAVRRTGSARAITNTGRFVAPRTMPRPALAHARNGLIVIGASTGGPRAISDLLDELPLDFSTPCIIVQHLPATFTAPFAAQLSRHARMPVKEAVSGDRLQDGRALVTPGSFHLLLRPDGSIELQPATDRDVYRPSIDLTMTSAAESYGAAAIGVLLTGMGDDGAEGIKQIHDAGGETYVQDPASCVVASMPECALARATANHVASPDRIGQLLAGRSRS